MNRFDHFLHQFVTPPRRATVAPRTLPIRIKHSRRPWKGTLRKQWWFTIYARNGRAYCHSEGYLDRQDCIDAANDIAVSQLIVEKPPDR